MGKGGGVCEQNVKVTGGDLGLGVGVVVVMLVS